MKKPCSLLLAFSFFLHSLPVSAATPLDLERSFSGQSVGQAEYFNSNKDKRMMIQVNILSGVARPGIHQVPDNVNLMDALALAGGLTSEADYEKVFVKRRAADKASYNTVQYDLQELIDDRKQGFPLLQNQDTILIDARPKTDQKLLTALTIIASMVGIVSGVVLIKNSKN